MSDANSKPLQKSRRIVSPVALSPNVDGDETHLELPPQTVERLCRRHTVLKLKHTPGVVVLAAPFSLAVQAQVQAHFGDRLEAILNRAKTGTPAMYESVFLVRNLATGQSLPPISEISTVEGHRPGSGVSGQTLAQTSLMERRVRDDVIHRDGLPPSEIRVELLKTVPIGAIPTARQSNRGGRR